MTTSEPEGLDLLVLGSGVAGLSAAVRASEHHGWQVGVLTKGVLDEATTRWAQGGVAAVLDTDPDSTDLHLADTLAAGAGLCDADAVRVLVDDGPPRVEDLMALGAIFDRDIAGVLELAREGGHSLPRILHAGGDATGFEIERALVAAVRRTGANVFERHFATDLLVEGGRCVGVEAIDADGRSHEVRATHVLMATGGAGQLYAVTTNPAESTGDGVAMGVRAGVAVADIEFVQFHPTALHDPRMPRPLLSEALRGHGALLRDAGGERFVDELQPRDVVARAITAKMIEQDTDHVWLDATSLEDFASRFPTMAESLVSVHLDPAKDWLPVAPAAHYLCGGLVTDLEGATSLPGLWAAGETTCTGVHGANRLASNSLLEGLVFAPRAIEAIAKGQDGPLPTGAMRAVLGSDVPPGPGAAEVIGGRELTEPAPGSAAVPVAATGSAVELRDQLQRTMTRGAGVLRDADSLAATGAVVAGVEAATTAPSGVAEWEIRNLATVARAVLTAANAREESRGAHTRLDFPDLDATLHCRLVLRGLPS
jgi:L-aspartate oxidase